VLRGGFGITIDPNSFRYLRDAYPAVISLQLTQQTTYQAAGSLRTGLPEVVGPDISKGIIDLPKDIGDTTFPAEIRSRLHQIRNVSLQARVGWGFVVQSAYVGLARGAADGLDQHQCVGFGGYRAGRASALHQVRADRGYQDDDPVRTRDL